MHDYFLRAPDEATFDKALEASELQGAAIDRIGAIEGATGFHLSLRAYEKLTDAEVKAFGDMLIPEPRNPVRVWL